MKIAVEARALTMKGGGVRTYVENLTRELKALSGLEVSLFTERPGVDLLLPWWLEVQVPRKIREINPDLVHFTKAAVPRRLNVPAVTTIYDLIPVVLPESQKWYGRWMWPAALGRAARVSSHIIAISEASKRDIVRHFEVSEDKVTVTPLAVDTDYFKPFGEGDVERVKGKFGIGGRYVLYVGTIEPRKNVPGLIRAFSEAAKGAAHDLVIAGRHYKGWEDVQREIEASGVAGRIKVIDFVPNEDLPALYSGADLFAWPSVYEGWGLPPQEAMACGTPVLVSDGGALPEVVGDAGSVIQFTGDNVSERFVDEDFESRFAGEMERLLCSEEERNGMSQAGLERVKQFLWRSVARKTVEVYEQAISN